MTLRSYVVNYLDPNFVREEELAAAIERKDPGYQSLKPWIRLFKLSPLYAGWDHPGNQIIDFGIPEAGKEWMIEAIFLQYTCNANVANRQIVVYYDPRVDIGQAPSYVLGPIMTASIAYSHVIAPNMPDYDASLAGGQLGGHWVLPFFHLVDEGIHFATALGQATDYWRAIMYYWER